MNQEKIGVFLKQLRKEKVLTQEQLAEQLNVSRRTVSRWETGSNMPDLDVLVELADYYDVELRELLDGERKEEPMNKELKETVLKVADYSKEEKKKLTKRLHMLFIAGLVSFTVYCILMLIGDADNFVGEISLGFAFGIMIVGVIMTSKHVSKIQSFKARLLQRK